MFSVFTPKTGFWPSYCQISTDLEKILHTPIVVRNTLVGRLRPRSARGRLQTKPERLCFFVILVTHPKSYTETTDRRDFGGKPSKWRGGRVLS